MAWPRPDGAEACRPLAVALAAAILVAGCGLTGATALRTDPGWTGGCGVGVGTDATLHGSAVDPRVAWAVTPDGRQRIEIIWPAGYRARFTPGLEILDAGGTIVAHEGDRVTGTCMPEPGDGDVLRIDATDLGPPAEPGEGERLRGSGRPSAPGAARAGRGPAPAEPQRQSDW